MGTPREDASAALLPTGGVVVTGGLNFASSAGYQSTELYDPAANVWHQSFGLNSGRYLADAVSLNDGRVLIAGGVSQDAGGQPTPTSELYPPPVAVGVYSGLYQPSHLGLGRQGTPVQWTVYQGTHTVTDAMNLGGSGATPAPLFDSGSLKTGTRYAFSFFSAGTYKYHSTASEPAPLNGTVTVPVAVSVYDQVSGLVFLVRWSSTEVTGFSYDVRYRVKPLGGAFGPWTTWQPTPSSTDWQNLAWTFTPQGVGTYQFEAKLKNDSTGRMSGFSPPSTVLATAANLHRALG
jgi:plastocyanin